MKFHKVNVKGPGFFCKCGQRLARVENGKNPGLWTWFCPTCDEYFCGESE